MTACDRTESYVERFLGGEASAEEVAAFESHAAGCSPCHGAFAGAAEFDASMKAVVPAMGAAFANPREAILGNIEVGRILARPSGRLHQTPRWRAVRWTLLLGFVATLAITFEGIAAVAIIKKKAKGAEAQMEVRAFHHFLHRYHADTRALPESGNANMVSDLVLHYQTDEHFRGKLPAFPFEAERLADRSALDPWGRPYIYRADGRTFRLYSAGENGRDDGGEGDDVDFTGAWRGGRG